MLNKSRVSLSVNHQPLLVLLFTKNQPFSRNRASLANLISTQVIKTIILKVVILARRYMIYNRGSWTYANFVSTADRVT